ncbi:MAG: hypothetical protein N2554_04680, partial [Fimbriimonadales bacterium]|nr:hypothetical protein [Fimbriimonadales bacterium]
IQKAVFFHQPMRGVLYHAVLGYNPFVMTAIGIVRGCIIELEQPIDMPEGSRVEVEVRPLDAPPLWGLLADKASMLDEMEAEVRRLREPAAWRATDETCSD